MVANDMLMPFAFDLDLSLPPFFSHIYLRQIISKISWGEIKATKNHPNFEFFFMLQICTKNWSTREEKKLEFGPGLLSIRLMVKLLCEEEHLFINLALYLKFWWMKKKLCCINCFVLKRCPPAFTFTFIKMEKHDNHDSHWYWEREIEWGKLKHYLMHVHEWIEPKYLNCARSMFPSPKWRAEVQKKKQKIRTHLCNHLANVC